MGRSQETFNKKEVRNKKEKKRKEKEKKRLARKENEKKGSLDDMIAYVDEHGNLSSEAIDPSQKTEVKLEDIEIGVPKSDGQEIDPIRKGVVSFFNDEKGYGFIRDMETKESVFVHINNTLEEIKEGNLVNYEVEMGAKGPAAVRVKIFKEVIEKKPATDKKGPATPEKGSATAEKKPETPEKGSAIAEKKPETPEKGPETAEK